METHAWRPISNCGTFKFQQGPPLSYSCIEICHRRWSIGHNMTVCPVNFLLIPLFCLHRELIDQSTYKFFSYLIARRYDICKKYWTGYHQWLEQPRGLPHSWSTPACYPLNALDTTPSLFQSDKLSTCKLSTVWITRVEVKHGAVKGMANVNWMIFICRRESLTYTCILGGE